jgi:hypothetical protein
MQVPDEPTVAVSPDEAVPPLDARRVGLHHERREPNSDSFSAPPGLEGPCRADDTKLVAERKAWVKRWSSAGNDLARAGKAGRSGAWPAAALLAPRPPVAPTRTRRAGWRPCREAHGRSNVLAGHCPTAFGNYAKWLNTRQSYACKHHNPEQIYISIRFAIQGTGKRGSARWKRWFYLLRAGRW